jgi:hypothetical protein
MLNEHRILFEPNMIGSMELKNRIDNLMKYQRELSVLMKAFLKKLMFEMTFYNHSPT